MANKKRIATSVAAVATAAAVLLGGTFAWQSVNQTALNETADVINPGGRLHNDMWYVSETENNHDIYVENFADEDIFARVRLSEFMEIVVNKGTPGEKVVAVAGNKTPLDDSTHSADDPTEKDAFDYEYVTHYFDQTSDTDEYWTWTTGEGESGVYYMPTFNMNKDSLAADLNGLYVDRVGGISNRGAEQYTYVDYSLEENQSKAANAIYDIDSNDVDELENVDISALIGGTADATAYEAAVKLLQETHEAAPVGSTNGLISMSDWLDLYNNDENTADYWVYDTDGWVYWSAPIPAGEATGLLLDGITLKQVMDDTWYYAIEAVGQFVTADDAGKGDDSGFYQDVDEAPSAEAEMLLTAIGVTLDGSEGDEPETHDLILGWTDATAGTVNAKPGDYIVVSLDENDFAEHGNGDLSVVNVTDEYGEELLIDIDYTYDSASQTLVILNEQITSITVNDNYWTYVGYINLPDEEEPEDPHGFSHILIGYDPENLQSDTFRDAGYAQPGDVIPFSAIAYYNDGTTAEISGENATWSITAVEGELAQDTSIAENGVLTIAEDQNDLTVINVEVSFTDRDGINHTKDQSFLLSEEAVTLTLKMTDDGPYYTGNWYSFVVTATNESGDTAPMAWSYDMIPQNHEDNLSVETEADATFYAYDAGNYYLRAWAEYLTGHYAEIPVAIEQNPDAGEEYETIEIALDAEGYWLFEDITPGTYMLQFTPSDYAVNSVSVANEYTDAPLPQITQDDAGNYIMTVLEDHDVAVELWNEELEYREGYSDCDLNITYTTEDGTDNKYVSVNVKTNTLKLFINYTQRLEDGGVYTYNRGMSLGTETTDATWSLSADPEIAGLILKTDEYGYRSIDWENIWNTTEPYPCILTVTSGDQTITCTLNLLSLAWDSDF